MDVAIRNGLLVTQDDARRVVRADLGIAGDRIAAIGDAPRATEEIDAAGCLVLPGLVNLHTHAAMTLLRGAGEDLPLERWLAERIWPAEARMTRDDIVAGTRLALAEMIAGGTTAFNDMYFWPEATADEARRAGVRAFLGPPMLDFATPEMRPAEMPKAAEAFLARWRGRDPLVVPTVAAHSAATVGDDTARAAADLCERHGALFHTHLHETRDEVYDVERRRGARPIDHYAKHGLVRRGIYAHGGWLTKGELGRMAQAHGAIAHCPVSNFKLATGGWLALPEFWDAGGVAGLGTDGAASNNSLDLWETMKLAAIAQKQHRWDASALPAQRALDMATRDGARALGLDAGVLAPGKLADVVVVDATRPHLTPVVDPVSALVYSAKASDVAWTIVAGRVLYARGEWRSVDAREAVERGGKAATRLRGT